jgi:hypothetical protein
MDFLWKTKEYLASSDGFGISEYLRPTPRSMPKATPRTIKTDLSYIQPQHQPRVVNTNPLLNSYTYAHSKSYAKREDSDINPLTVTRYSSQRGLPPPPPSRPHSHPQDKYDIITYRLSEFIGNTSLTKSDYTILPPSIPKTPPTALETLQKMNRGMSFPLIKYPTF